MNEFKQMLSRALETPWTVLFPLFFPIPLEDPEIVISRLFLWAQYVHLECLAYMSLTGLHITWIPTERAGNGKTHTADKNRIKLSLRQSLH